MQIVLRVIRWTSLISFPLFLLTVPSAASASIGSCADSLISSGVNKSAAGAACSDALEPDDLAACVEEIELGANVKGIQALQSCYRVRRPDELASCVTTISGSIKPEMSVMALDNCRRSLLPDRYAECTLDLADVTEISDESAMKSCLAAELTPNNVAPEATE